MHSGGRQVEVRQLGWRREPCRNSGARCPLGRGILCPVQDPAIEPGGLARAVAELRRLGRRRSRTMRSGILRWLSR